MRRKGRREGRQEKMKDEKKVSPEIGPLLSNFSALYWEPARETMALKSSGCLLCSYLMLDQLSSLSVSDSDSVFVSVCCPSCTPPFLIPPSAQCCLAVCQTDDGLVIWSSPTQKQQACQLTPTMASHMSHRAGLLLFL